MMKFSKAFDRDYKFYFKSIGLFNFCGTMYPKFKAIYSKNGKSAKEVFYLIDSVGKNVPTYEPVVLDNLLLCKASVNFQIKQWAKGRADGTLSKREFNGEGETLEWKKVVSKGITSYLPIYHKNIQEQYDLPEWVIKAVEKQKYKYYDN